MERKQIRAHKKEEDKEVIRSKIKTQTKKRIENKMRKDQKGTKKKEIIMNKMEEKP